MIKSSHISMRGLATMPWIQLFASPACNLKCDYCSQQSVRRHKVTHDFLQDPELLEFICRIPPTHIYLSGGEPLIHPGTKEFISLAGRRGHKISIDTNLMISGKKIEELISSWDPDWIGIVNVSHHLICGITLEDIESRIRPLKEADIKHFVKYIGVPEHFPLIERYMNVLKDRGTGAAVTVMQGNWKGRTIPEEYSLDETITLLDLVTLNTHGLQLFDGIHSRGMSCRGGQDFIAYNMHDDRKIISCCHGSSYPLNMNDIYFETGTRNCLECRIDQCMADMVFICGINGITDEIERFDKLCNGNFKFQGVESVIHFAEEIIDKGYRLVNNSKFLAVRKHVSNSCHSVTASGFKISYDEEISHIHSPKEINHTAEDRVRDGKTEEAKSLLHNLIRKYPENSTALNNLGVVYLQEGDMDNAIKYFEEALEFDPDNGYALVNFAAAMASCGNFDTAAALCKKYQQTNTTNDEAAGLLSIIEEIQILHAKGKNIA